MLNAGTRLGVYEIHSEIGAGGMGEVYRARDTKLGRDVALKVLPEAFASDAERMGRFEREAKVLASLNHPNIAAIYGFEESSGAGSPARAPLRALVMELVEGPTLAERIAQGTIPLDEALPIAKQMCEALEYAHERGIVHRDLKPANVKITPEGIVKLLDFGLAKALEGDSLSGDMSNSPTISRMATQAGIILGTAAYMSPEQAKGRPVDRRADIWAFGCVLYEMLTGKKPFEGETISDLLAAVIMKDPDWGALPAGTPPHLRVLLHRCLQKDPKQRLRDIGDARISLEEVLSGAPDASVGATPTLTQRKWLWLGWGAAATLAVAFTFVLIGYIARAPHSVRTIVAQIAPPEGANWLLDGLSPGMPALSPDGTQFAFAAFTADGKQLLWVRPLNSSDARPLVGTDGGAYPFWSPDGRSLGYSAKGKLYQIDVSGGPPRALADANGLGGSWGRDGTILVGGPVTLGEGISEVPASGNSTRKIMKTKTSVRGTGWPQLLPDGKHFLFYAISKDAENSGTYAALLGGGEPKLILRGDSDAEYASPGYLLFIRDGTLMAQKFDASSLRLTGEAMPVADDVGLNGITRRGMFSVSENGTLVYETATRVVHEILWYDRTGKQIAETGTPATWGSPSISPDGHKLAISLSEPGVAKPDVWVYDLARGIKTRLTFSPAVNADAFWSPDGRTVGFVSTRSGQPHLYQKAADGTGSVTPLVAGDAAEYFGSWSADSRYFIFQRAKDPRNPGANGPGSGDIWAMPLFGDRKPFPVVQNGQFNAIQPALSPDRKWLAYVSDESGQEEVYIVAFLHGSGRWEVSAGGGSWPRWRRDGKEIFYRSPEDKIMSVDIVEQGASLSIGKAQALFQANPAPSTLGPAYDISPDGKKFVIVSAGRQQTFPPLTVVANWPALLKKGAQ